MSKSWNFVSIKKITVEAVFLKYNSPKHCRTAKNLITYHLQILGSNTISK